MNEQPVVSVVMCTFNGERFLEAQIESILKQTYSNFELIISDDASTDGTKQILKQYENHEQTKIFYQQKNIGLIKNFDFATSKSKGVYIAYSDQDDVWLKYKLEKLVAKIGNSVLVYSDSVLTDEHGKSMDKKLSDLRNMYTGDDSRGYILYNCVWGHGMMLRRDAMERSLPMPDTIHHDVWLAFKSLTFGGIVFLDEVLTLYRQHQTSTSKTLPQKTESRNQTKRWTDYRKQLDWLQLMHDHERPKYQPFYKKLIELYKNKEKGFSFYLFSFLVKNRKVLFMFSKKNYMSQIIEILKQSRGEKRPQNN
jgi:glycosyltransferase involved in cell wall biosynthesis